MSLRTRRGLGTLAALLLVVGACTTTPAATPTPAASSGTSPAASAPASAEASAPASAEASAPASAEASAPASEEQTLTYAIDGDISFITNANADVPSAQATQFLFNGIYTLNADLQPAPDLAAELATVSEDGLTWTIPLVENAFFSDGSNMTSADVVAAYEMAKSPNCRFNPDNCAAVANFVESVEATGDYEVTFTLTQKYAPFTTVVLPGVYIDNSKAVDESFARFQEGAANVAAEDIQTLIDEITTAEEDATAAQEADPEAPGVDYTVFSERMTGLLTDAGVELGDPALFVDADGAEDPNAYAGDLLLRLKALNESLTAEEADAKAAAYVYLDYQRAPSGTGPFMLEEFKPGESLTYVRNEKYHFGAPQIQRMFLPIIKDDVAGAAALKAGQIDWKYSFTIDGYEIVRDDIEAGTLKQAEYPDFGYFALYFNLHPAENSAGGYVPLFSIDARLRQAVAQCFDKEATVAAATNGTGVALYSEVPPASWAYNPDLPKYAYDVAAANALLDEAGATDSDGDGIREINGRALSTKVYVREGRPDRIKYMELLRDQVAECGIEIIVTPGDFTNVLLKILDWPHIPPGDETPYDGYFGGFSTSLDPDPFSIYHSSECTSEEKPSTFNYICWENEEVDTLIQQGLEELDQDKRATIYQELGVIVATELPAIYAWAEIQHEGLSGTFGPDDLQYDSPLFYWEIHKLTNQKAAS